MYRTHARSFSRRSYIVCRSPNPELDGREWRSSATVAALGLRPAAIRPEDRSHGGVEWIGFQKSPLRRAEAEHGSKGLQPPPSGAERRSIRVRIAEAANGTR